MPDLITVQLDTVAVLAVRLGLLAQELDGETSLAGATGITLGAALSGPPAAGLTATGAAWTTVLAALTDRAGAVASTLTSAVASYRELDALLSESLVGRYGYAPVAR